MAAPQDLDVTVRLVDEDEWASWRAARLRALQEAPTAFCSTYEREAEFTEQDYRERLRGDGPSVLASAGGRPVGMGAGYRDDTGALQVVAMWVDPAWRGQRTGRRILDAIVGWARERELPVHLDVTVGNSTARTLYESCGFVGTGRTEPLRPGSPHRVERLTLRG